MRQLFHILQRFIAGFTIAWTSMRGTLDPSLRWGFARRWCNTCRIPSEGWGPGLCRRDARRSYNVTTKYILPVLLALVLLPAHAALAEGGDGVAGKGTCKVGQKVDSPKLKKDEEDKWYAQCWICPVLEIAEKARKDIGFKAVGLIGSSLADLVSTMLYLWLIVQAGILLMPFGTMQAGSEILNTVLIRIFMTVIVLGMISNFDWFVRIYDSITDAGDNLSSYYVKTAMQKYSNGLEYDLANQPAAAPGGLRDNSQTSFANLQLMQNAMGVGIEMAKNMMDPLMQKGPFTIFTEGGGPEIMRGIAGITLLVLNAIILISIPFQFINALFATAAVTALSPTLIASALFPYTRNYGIAGLKVLVSAALQIMFMGVVIALHLAMLDWVADQNGGSLTEMGKLKLACGIAEPAFWHMVAICLTTMAMLNATQQMAGMAVNLPIGLNIAPVGTQILSTFGNAFKGIGGSIYRNAMPWQRGLNQQRMRNQQMSMALKRMPNYKTPNPFSVPGKVWNKMRGKNPAPRPKPTKPG